MINPPQNVTSRYIRSLLCRGENLVFRVCNVTRDIAQVEGIVVGKYYKALVKCHTQEIMETGIGATPEQAVHNALIKHGVTFR